MGFFQLNLLCFVLCYGFHVVRKDNNLKLIGFQQVCDNNAGRSWRVFEVFAKTYVYRYMRKVVRKPGELTGLLVS